MVPAIFAFDVDETLEVSGGPVSLAAVALCAAEGNIVGICGNWAVLCQRYPGWHRLFSFIGTMDIPKAAFLRQIRTYIPAKEYVMVGNDPTYFGKSQDRAAAEAAGWRFIREKDFALGAR